MTNAQIKALLTANKEAAHEKLLAYCALNGIDPIPVNDALAKTDEFIAWITKRGFTADQWVEPIYAGEAQLATSYGKDNPDNALEQPIAEGFVISISSRDVAGWVLMDLAVRMHNEASRRVGE